MWIKYRSMNSGLHALAKIEHLGIYQKQEITENGRNAPYWCFRNIKMEESYTLFSESIAYAIGKVFTPAIDFDFYENEFGTFDSLEEANEALDLIGLAINDGMKFFDLASHCEGLKEKK